MRLPVKEALVISVTKSIILQNVILDDEKQDTLDGILDVSELRHPRTFHVQFQRKRVNRRGEYSITTCYLIKDAKLDKQIII